MQRIIGPLVSLALSLNYRRKQGNELPFDFLVLRLLYRLIACFPAPVRISIGEQSVSYRFPTTSAAEAGLHILATEKPLIQDVVQFIGEDDVFYDIGANVGVFAAAVQGKTYAFEPVPANIIALTQNLRSGHGQLIGTALSDMTNLLWMNMEDIRNGSPTASPGEVNEGVALAGLALDDLDLPAPSVAKIDVEGAELSVLQGGKETFSGDTCQRLYIEVHEGKGIKYDDIEALLTDYGFTGFKILDERGEELFVRAEKQSQ